MYMKMNKPFKARKQRELLWQGRKAMYADAINELNLYRNKTIEACEKLNEVGFTCKVNPELLYNRLVDQGFAPRRAMVKTIEKYGEEDFHTVHRRISCVSDILYH